MPKELNDFKLLKAEMRAFYNMWRRESTYSAALGMNIVVSKKGWNHIIGDKQPRPGKDVMHKLNLLPYAKEVIKISTSIKTIRKNNGINYYALEANVECEYKNLRLPSRQVRVIVIEDSKGNKIFYSVMTTRRRKKEMSHALALRR